jgi:hypothetical protein
MLYHFSLQKISSRIISIILLVVILIFITSKHIDLHKDDSVDKMSIVEQWHQPITLNNTYPLPISKYTWALEFNEIEEVINRLEFDSNEEILINAYTSEKLQLVISQLNRTSKDIEWDRLEFLIKKNLDNNNGDIFYNLVRSYYFYHKDESSHLNRISNAETSEKLDLLKNSSNELLKIQSSYFGYRIAAKLFKRKNITTSYLNARKIISLENGLSRSEKKDRLLRLSKNYKKSISQW